MIYVHRGVYLTPTRAFPRSRAKPDIFLWLKVVLNFKKEYTITSIIEISLTRGSTVYYPYSTFDLRIAHILWSRIADIVIQKLTIEYKKLVDNVICLLLLWIWFSSSPPLSKNASCDTIAYYFRIW